MPVSPHAAPAQWPIAIVDDDGAVRQALNNLLRSVGYSTLEFDSAEAFLASGQLDGFGCAVLDIKLKGMSGIELQERLLALRVTVPTIVVTGHGDAAMRQRALRAGALAFLRKPIDVDALLGHIQQALAGRGARP